MTEDPRIAQTLDELAREGKVRQSHLEADYGSDAVRHRAYGRGIGYAVDRIRAILDSGPDRDDLDAAVERAECWEEGRQHGAAQAVRDPRVYFPGDTVPAGRAVFNDLGVLIPSTGDSWVTEFPVVAAPTRSELGAIVDRARAARANAEWQHTEGINP